MVQKIFALLKSRKILIYLLGGFLTYFLKSGLTWLFTDVLSLSYRYSYIISLSIVIILTFLYNLKLTFKAEGYILGRFLLYVGSVLTFNLIDYALVVFLTEKLSFHYLLSIVFVTGTLMVCKFLVFNFLIFRNRKKPDNSASEVNTR